MHSRTSVWYLLVVLGLLSVYRIQAAAPVPSPSKAELELQALAANFLKVVQLLNNEPDKDESLGAFFGRLSKEQQEELAGTIRLDAKGVVTLEDGSVVSFTRNFRSCALFTWGSIVAMDYWFSAAGHVEMARISVEATFGKPEWQTATPPPAPVR